MSEAKIVMIGLDYESFHIACNLQAICRDYHISDELILTEGTHKKTGFEYTIHLGCYRDIENIVIDILTHIIEGYEHSFNIKMDLKNMNDFDFISIKNKRGCLILFQTLSLLFNFETSDKFKSLLFQNFNYSQE